MAQHNRWPTVGVDKVERRGGRGRTQLQQVAELGSRRQHPRECNEMLIGTGDDEGTVALPPGDGRLVPAGPGRKRPEGRIQTGVGPPTCPEPTFDEALAA